MLANKANKKDGMDYEDPKHLSKTKKSGIRVISEMSKPQIAWYLLWTSRYQISMTMNFVAIGVWSYHHIYQVFF